MENFRTWLISSIVLDVAVILVNLVEENFMRKNWRLLDRVDHFLLSLSISDLVTGLSTLVIDSWHLYHAGNSLELHTVNTLLREVFEGFFLFSVFASVFHISVIAVERLVSFRFPGKLKWFIRTRPKAVCISLIWLLSMICSAVFAVLHQYGFDNHYGRIVRASIFILAISVVFMAYTVLSFMLALLHRKLPATDSVNNNQRGSVQRITITCLLIGFSFVGCVLPITMGYFSDTFYHPVANLLITLNSLINPVIYMCNALCDNRRRVRSSTLMYLLGQNADVEREEGEETMSHFFDDRSQEHSTGT